MFGGLVAVVLLASACSSSDEPDNKLTLSPAATTTPTATASVNTAKIKIGYDPKSAGFEPSALAPDKDFTSLYVTLDNGSDQYLAATAASFALIDSKGARHSSATGLGMSKAKPFPTTIIMPGQKVGGVITVRGTFTISGIAFTGKASPKPLPVPTLPKDLPTFPNFPSAPAN
jgi:hypothetical protein